MIAVRPKKIRSERPQSLVSLNSALGNRGMSLLNEHGKVLSWNTISEKMTGYSARDIVGRNYSILFTRESNRRRESEKALRIAEREDRVIEEGIRIRKNGSRICVRSFLTLVSDVAKDKKIFIITMQDITADKARESKRDEYIGLASHELRNPLATLSLYSELLSLNLGQDRDKKNLAMLRDMQSQTARLVTLVDDLLIVNKIEGGTLVLHKEAFPINQLLKDTVRNFQVLTHTHTIHVKGTRRYVVHADKSRIAQVIINLLTNAVKYSPYAHTVNVHIKRVRGKCEISVQDFGHGISKKDQARIFKRFFRTKQAEIDDSKGSGLGLYISKEIIKHHRERLWLESAQGKGTTFFFTLTLSPSATIRSTTSS